ncbi:hypothetical protein AJ79_04149 [Helicocarpus griseus UAMH5409]|uniref:Uncharacterized protein n=1 Tax=Helicocarpus griseus UAMH5409 TaxID=1447875 RepID=A0A2B7XV48_9EURO|nr:hypothetical protein AJ79_04149 [Helicocarpus griseus UAMH5409]
MKLFTIAALASIAVAAPAPNGLPFKNLPTPTGGLPIPTGTGLPIAKPTDGPFHFPPLRNPVWW